MEIPTRKKLGDKLKDILGRTLEVAFPIYGVPKAIGRYYESKIPTIDKTQAPTEPLAATKYWQEKSKQAQEAQKAISSQLGGMQYFLQSTIPGRIGTTLTEKAYQLAGKQTPLLKPEEITTSPLAKAGLSAAGFGVDYALTGAAINSLAFKSPFIRQMATRKPHITNVLKTFGTGMTTDQLREPINTTLEERKKLFLNDIPAWAGLAVGGELKVLPAIPVYFASSYLSEKLNGQDNKTAFENALFTTATMSALKLLGQPKDALKVAKSEAAKKLGVKPNATPAEIKKAYHDLAFQYHPDRPTGNEAKFKEINEAYKILTNPESIISPQSTLWDEIRDLYRYYTSPENRGVALELLRNIPMGLSIQPVVPQQPKMPEKPIKPEVKPEAKPEVKPKEVKPTTESQPPSTMPLRAQNLPVERGLAQEGIKLPTEAKQPPKLPDNNISKTYHQPTKPSKIGLDIKQFGKEVGIPIGKTAQYTPISTSNEVEKAKQFIQANLNDWKLYLSGEKEIPSEISHSAFIDASRDLSNTNYDKDLITTFANSPLISETSKIAQELSLLAEKDPDSFFAKIKEVKEAREAQAKKTTPRNVPDIKKSISNSVKQSVIQKLLEKSPANTPLVKALKSGEITIEQLMSMETPERINVLTKYLGDKAPQANLEFEKKQILKHIETGINNWISKYGFIGRYSPEKMTEMKKSLEEWKQEQFRRVFNPKEYETFLQSLAEKQVGVSITEDEANKLFNLTQGVETLKKNWNPETNQWSSEADRIKYGASKVLLEKYTEGLKKPSTIKDSLIARLNEFKATSQNNVPKAIFDLVKDTIKSISDLSISMVASIDNSFIGRQGIKVLYTKPKIWGKTAYQSVSDFIKTIKDKDKVWDAILADYYSRPNYMNGSYKTAKILPRSFERFPTATPEKIPLVGRVFKASEVAFKGSDLMMRSNLYDLMSKIASNNGVDMTDPYQIKSFGTVINSLTGRGQWGRMGDDSVVRWIIWAPNLLKGNIDVLTAHAGQDISPEARKFAANNLLKIIASISTVLLIARALDEKSVELDSRSSNFGKIMIGPTHDIPVDISGGMMSLVTLASRLVTGETKSSRTGKITSLYNPEYGQPTMWDVLVNFLEGKTTPMTHAVINLLNNQMYGGKQPTFGRMAESLFVPISVQNVSEISETEVYRQPAALWAVILDAFGLNSNTPIRQVKYDEPIMKEIKRLQDSGQDTVQTSFISGFLQENPMLSVEDNKIIFGKLTNLSNQKLGGLIKTEQYQNATDEEKAKMISSFMDKNRDFIYEGFIANKIKGLSGQELIDMLSYLKKSGVLNETRFKKLIKNGVIKL